MEDFVRELHAEPPVACHDAGPGPSGHTSCRCNI